MAKFTLQSGGGFLTTQSASGFIINQSSTGITTKDVTFSVTESLNVNPTLGRLRNNTANLALSLPINVAVTKISRVGLSLNQGSSISSNISRLRATTYGLAIVNDQSYTIGRIKVNGLLLDNSIAISNAQLGKFRLIGLTLSGSSTINFALQKTTIANLEDNLVILYTYNGVVTTHTYRVAERYVFNDPQTQYIGVIKDQQFTVII